MKSGQNRFHVMRSLKWVSDPHCSAHEYSMIFAQFEKWLCSFYACQISMPHVAESSCHFNVRVMLQQELGSISIKKMILEAALDLRVG